MTTNIIDKEPKGYPWLFLLLTFIWTYIFYIPMAISGEESREMPWSICLILGGAGPTIIGILLVLLTYSKEARKSYWNRAYSFKRLRWSGVLLTLLIPVFLFLGGVLINSILNGPNPGYEQGLRIIENPISLPLIILSHFISGPISEEFGWRGYGQYHLEKRKNPYISALIIGFLWGIWHIPLVFTADQWHRELGVFTWKMAAYIGNCILDSLIMAWLFKRTVQSILGAMFYHFSTNFIAQTIAPFTFDIFVYRLMLGIIIMIPIIVFTEMKKLKTNDKVSINPN